MRRGEGRQRGVVRWEGNIYFVLAVITFIFVLGFKSDRLLGDPKTSPQTKFGVDSCITSTCTSPDNISFVLVIKT